MPGSCARLTIRDASNGRALTGGPTFSLGNRAYRLAWIISWGLLARWTPRPLWGWRRFLLRAFGAKLSSRSLVYGSARIWSPANLSMGDGSAIGPRVKIYSMGMISIGDGALVSQDAHLCAGTHDPEHPQFQLEARPIAIGARAWIAAEAFVGPGVTVGDGAVLGARGVAMRNLEPWVIYSGNPAQPIRPRRIRGG